MKKKPVETIVIWVVGIWVVLMVGYVCYTVGYRDGQINAIEGKIDYEIHYDSTYIEKE